MLVKVLDEEEGKKLNEDVAIYLNVHEVVDLLHLMMTANADSEGMFCYLTEVLGWSEEAAHGAVEFGNKLEGELAKVEEVL